LHFKAAFVIAAFAFAAAFVLAGFFAIFSSLYGTI
jgi:hypothetical protein